MMPQYDVVMPPAVISMKCALRLLKKTFTSQRLRLEEQLERTQAGINCPVNEGFIQLVNMAITEVVDFCCKMLDEHAQVGPDMLPHEFEEILLNVIACLQNEYSEFQGEHSVFHNAAEGKFGGTIIMRPYLQTGALAIERAREQPRVINRTKAEN